MSNPLVYIDVYQAKPRLTQRITGRPQRWRWTAKSGDNHRTLATASEAYTNRQDCIDAVFLLFSEDSNVYLRESERGNVNLRMARPL